MNTMTQEKKLNETKEENRVSGTVGAFLFALVGGAIYFALWQVGVYRLDQRIDRGGMCIQGL